jgi:hypothetical protein
MTKKGFFTLTTAKDLFLKLEHDLAEVQRKPSDPYAAFNFFVTVEHILDWLHPGNADEGTRKVRRKNEPLLALVSHLASGAKHFDRLRPHHKSLRESGLALVPAPVVRVASRRSGYMLARPPYPILYVSLDGAAAAKYGKLIDVVKLAQEVYRYWRNDLAFR